MDSTSLMLTLLLMLACTFTIQFLLSLHARISGKSNNRKLPPGPSFLTIARNLVELGKRPQQTLAKLASAHGPMIMRLKLGQVTTIVISSPSVAKEVLQTHDVSFSDRMIPQAANVHNHDRFSLPFLPISPLWRDLRRICINQMFASRALDASRGLRREKLRELLGDVRASSLAGEPVGIGRAAFKALINLLSNAFFSLDFVRSTGEVDEYYDMVGNLARAIGTLNVGDFFPMLKMVDPHGIRWCSHTYVPMLFRIFDGYIDQRLKLREGGNYVTSNDMLDALLDISQEDSQKMNTEMIKHLFLDLVVAGTDTTPYALERAMAELLRNPDAMSKAKRELEQTIGTGKLVEESDIPNLPYLQAIVKETLRMHPPAPFLLPRKARADVELCGYVVPKGAQVIVNEWAIGRDPSVWDDPNSFLPERFLGSKIDVKGHDFRFTPFGGGRRICPASALATRMLHTMLGSLINSFDWRLENGMKPQDVDLDQQLRAVALGIKS